MHYLGAIGQTKSDYNYIICDSLSDGHCISILIFFSLKAVPNSDTDLLRISNNNKRTFMAYRNKISSDMLETLIVFVSWNPDHFAYVGSA